MAIQKITYADRKADYDTFEKEAFKALAKEVESTLHISQSDLKKALDKTAKAAVDNALEHYASQSSENALFVSQAIDKSAREDLETKWKNQYIKMASLCTASKATGVHEYRRDLYETAVKLPLATALGIPAQDINTITEHAYDQMTSRFNVDNTTRSTANDPKATHDTVSGRINAFRNIHLVISNALKARQKDFATEISHRLAEKLHSALGNNNNSPLQVALSSDGHYVLETKEYSNMPCASAVNGCLFDAMKEAKFPGTLAIVQNKANHTFKVQITCPLQFLENVSFKKLNASLKEIEDKEEQLKEFHETHSAERRGKVSSYAPPTPEELGLDLEQSNNNSWVKKEQGKAQGKNTALSKPDPNSTHEEKEKKRRSQDQDPNSPGGL